MLTSSPTSSSRHPGRSQIRLIRDACVFLRHAIRCAVLCPPCLLFQELGQHPRASSTGGDAHSFCFRHVMLPRMCCVCVLLRHAILLFASSLLQELGEHPRAGSSTGGDAYTGCRCSRRGLRRECCSPTSLQAGCVHTGSSNGSKWIRSEWICRWGEWHCKQACRHEGVGVCGGEATCGGCTCRGSVS